MGNNILIEAINLRKSFHVGEGDIEVVKGVSFKVEKGEFVIIFGPSGCGKSTLLHSLLGLEKPTNGKVIVDGKDFYSIDEDERALYRRHKVGMIFQQPLWIRSFNVMENIIFPLRLLDFEESAIQERVKKTLSIVGMEKWASYVPTELSAGQQQKINLARSLMVDPILIIADEPTGNLDTVSGEELLKTFVQLTQQGKTIIMVTHDLEYLKYATKIFHMVDGEVIEEYDSKSIKKISLQGKKHLNGEILQSDIRDKEFLKKRNV